MNIKLEPPYLACKVEYSTPINDITTWGCIINLNNKKQYKSPNFLWDTGATISVISLHVAEKLNLKAVSMQSIHTANDVVNSKCYLVDIILPNGLRVVKNLVSGLHLSENIDVLIGMDIIKQGSFLFSTDNKTHKHFFQFVIPSLPRLENFVEKASGRNERSYKKLKKEAPNHPLLSVYKQCIRK